MLPHRTKTRLPSPENAIDQDYETHNPARRADFVRRSGKQLLYARPSATFNNPPHNMLITVPQAITEMSRQLRKGNGKTGLVLANGGWISYQHVVCLSSSPRVDGLPYPDCNPLAEHVTDIQVPMLEEAAEGEAMIEVFLDVHPPSFAACVAVLQQVIDLFWGRHTPWTSIAVVLPFEVTSLAE